MTLYADGLDPAGGDPIKDGSDQGFMADVIQESQKQPVIVDFWAPWCGPCRQLGPALEKNVRAAKGKVKLVKINIDENPQIAGQLGVRSIPAVYAFQNGQPVDGFMGAVPESQIKLFIDRLSGAGNAEDIVELLKAGQESLALGDLGGAAQSYAMALQLDPENAKALAGMARCYIAGGEPEQARQLIESLTEDKQKDPDVAGVKAALELSSGADAGDANALKAAVEQTPGDHQARFDLANALAARGDLSGAVDHLLAIVERDRAWNDEAARKQLVKIFEAAGPASDVAKSGRRRLSALLFS
ncbi:MAG: thioredoxin [Hyphomonadaceae bacterium]